MTDIFTRSVNARPKYFPYNEKAAADRPGHDRVDRAPLDFLIDQTDADEHGDDHADQVDRRQAHVRNHLVMLRNGEVRQQHRQPDQQPREQTPGCTRSCPVGSHGTHSRQ
jgi:hypothetical protein